MRAQVAIVGAGPAGLFLGHLLAQGGVDAVVLERRSRAYVEQRIRAGVIEHGVADLLERTGVGARMRREGLVHEGVELRFSGRGHRIDFRQLTGKTITVYGQQELVKDLIAARVAADLPLLFEAEVVALEGVPDPQPTVRFRHDGRNEQLRCDVVVGADGFHGISRSALPAGAYRTYERAHPFAWLGILAAVAPSSEELIYSRHDRGFALHSMRSPEISRLYLQVAPDEDLADWPDGRIWEELQLRFATDPGFHLSSGPILERSTTAMRSFVLDPLTFGSLVLAGDAAHIVPPTGAKGMNLALADVLDLSVALLARFCEGDETALKEYSPRAVARAWQAQEFSTFMTTLLHPLDGDAFGNQLQIARLEQLAHADDAARHLAERYVDLATTAPGIARGGH